MIPRELSDSIGDLMETLSGLLIEHDDGQTDIETFRKKVNEAVGEFIDKHKSEYSSILVHTKPTLGTIEIHFDIQDPETAFQYEQELRVRRNN